jgi:hypothetical protein
MHALRRRDLGFVAPSLDITPRDVNPAVHAL